ncbi:MAG: Sortase family protein [Aeromicrobium sp.]|jgi:LPXTG-site transpeptidase (sortase) family protein|nr:Sortase family protein [Aeromicrobium sp.]
MLAAAAAIVVAVGAATAVLLTRDDGRAAGPHASASTSPNPQRTAPFGSGLKPIGVPARVIIPDVKVDAAILQVGTTAAGAQDVPHSLKDTGWWRDGQQPGQPGNAVIVGHTASKDDGVFDNLSDLEKDDRITVRGQKGTLDYRVTSEREVKVEKFKAESDRIYRETGPSGLVLMTCGDWNGERFETTIIVYAKAIGKAS